MQIGRHVPPYADVVPQFLTRFAKAYAPEPLSKINQVIAVAASHHRFLWIHPFPDGNGRVARLLAHAYLKQIGLGNSLWSVSRGLARQVQRYRDLLAAADQQRSNDYDGRGNLTMKGLLNFCAFFLETCLDQVGFMASLLENQRLLKRIEIYVASEVETGVLLPGSFALLKAALLEGEIQRGRASAITGYQSRQARSVLKRLTEKGLLVSSSPKGPVRLAFPVTAAEQWFPRLWA